MTMNVIGTLRYSSSQFAMPMLPWLAIHQLIDLMHRSYYTASLVNRLQHELKELIVNGLDL